MKHLLIFLLIPISFSSVFGQKNENAFRNSNYYKLFEGSEQSGRFRTELRSDIDTTWNKWQLRGYNFGFNTKITPMYTMVNGILATPYMIQVRGNEDEQNKKRWGFHVFEGFARDDKSRITMLVNKHIEEGRPVAELYYYGTVYNHSEEAYNWFRIGSDVRQHSYLFGRDKAIFYGSLKLSNALTLGQIGKDNIRTEGTNDDDEAYHKESAKHVNYKSLKNSEDGTIFYDKDNDIVVVKIKGKWMRVMVEELPEGVKYDF